MILDGILYLMKNHHILDLADIWYHEKNPQEIMESEKARI